jgi:hypothetical protein
VIIFRALNEVFSPFPPALFSIKLPFQLVLFLFEEFFVLALF